MELADAADAVAINAGLQIDFVYYEWMVNENVPTDVTLVIIHSSVRAIKDKAFSDRRQLVNVILNEDLEKIRACAFQECTSIQEIRIPNAVKTIKKEAFKNCSWLMSVTLGDGLEEIGEEAFWYCKSLEEIVIPNAVKRIKRGAFFNCYGLKRSNFFLFFPKTLVLDFNQHFIFNRMQNSMHVFRSFGGSFFNN